MALNSGRCQYHPDRPGLGVCVECRSVICTECTTQFEGINRCAKCLSARLAKTSRLEARRDWAPSNVMLAMLSVALLFGCFWGLARLAKL